MVTWWPVRFSHPFLLSTRLHSLAPRACCVFATQSTPDVSKWTLEKNSELRFEVPDAGSGTVTVTSGHAECNGVELAVGVPYVFPPGKVGAVSTFHGCEVRCVYAVGKRVVTRGLARGAVAPAA